MSALTWVYLVHASGTNQYKVGQSSNPRDRLQALQTANGNRLELIWLEQFHLRMERLIHERLAEHRLSGEWFELESLAEFNQAIAELGPENRPAGMPSPPMAQSRKAKASANGARKRKIRRDIEQTMQRLRRADKNVAIQVHDYTPAIVFAFMVREACCRRNLFQPATRLSYDECVPFDLAKFAKLAARSARAQMAKADARLRFRKRDS